MSIAEKLVTIAENEQRVYDAGVQAGRQAERSITWDSFQTKGNRTNYQSFFDSSRGWDMYNFYPKYDIRPEGTASRMFFNWGGERHDYFDLAQRLEECGVVLDTSKATSLNNAFNSSHFSRIPTIDITGTVGTTDGAGAIFSNSWTWLETIDKIITNENVIYNNSFGNCTGLKNLVIEGTIGQNGFNVSACKKLSKASLLSILNACNIDVSESPVTIILPNYCIDGQTSTSDLVINGGDIELTEACTAAINKGYLFSFA